MPTATMDNPSQLMEVTTEIVDVTPEIAHALLAKNTHNRNLSPQKVEQLAGAIRRGEWSLNGDAIRISRTDILLDGQHRLHAVIKANKAIRTLIVRGLDDATQETMDTGKKRSLGDMLRLRGEKNCSRLAAVIHILYSYSQTGTISSKGLAVPPTPQQLLAFLDRHPDIRGFLNTPRDDYNKHLLTPGVSATLYYLFSLVDQEDAALFFEYLASGEGLASGDPIYTLRERLLKEQAKPHGRIEPTVRAAFAVKAYNAWRAGSKLHNLKWQGGGAKPEQFPRISGLDFKA